MLRLRIYTSLQKSLKKKHSEKGFPEQMVPGSFLYKVYRTTVFFEKIWECWVSGLNAIFNYGKLTINGTRYPLYFVEEGDFFEDFLSVAHMDAIHVSV